MNNACQSDNQAARESREDYWAIIYEDADRKPELFTDEAAARATFKDRIVSWACHLFHRVSLKETP